jgi:hypothetical protein
MLIYCNGDSFTAGVGLGDYLIPTYPGVFSEDELESKKIEISKFSDTKSFFYRKKFVNYDEVVDNKTVAKFYDDTNQSRVVYENVYSIVEKNLSYPAQLEKIDKSIKTINAARAGSSMGGICYRTILDLLNYKSQGIKIDLVIIQLTSIGRYEIFDTNQHDLMIDRPLSVFTDPLDINISKAIISRYTNEDYLIKFLFHLASLKETVISITGKSPLIIDSMNGEWILTNISSARHYIKNNNKECIDYFENLVNHSMINYSKLNLMRKCAKKIQRPFEHDGHYQIEVHKLTAQEIYKSL